MVVMYSQLKCYRLFGFHSNYGSILHQLRDKAQYWSKIVVFYTSLHSTPPLGGVPVGILTSRLVWEN